MYQMDRKVEIMGIVNLTPDSFFPGSRILSPDGTLDQDALVARVAGMIRDGANIIDVGACSTRPGSEPVSAGEEWERLSSPLRLIRDAFPGITLSIDTFRASIVSKAFDAIGPFIINDVSGASDHSILPLASSLGLTYICTHCSTEGSPDITDRESSFFREFSSRAEEAGVEDWILDPGFGFGKSLEENYSLLENLPSLRSAGRKILVGVSRKSMVYKLLGITPEESLVPTQALHMAALERGADILRVHDVAETVQTVKLWRSLNAGMA